MLHSTPYSCANGKKRSSLLRWTLCKDNLVRPSLSHLEADHLLLDERASACSDVCSVLKHDDFSGPPGWSKQEPAKASGATITRFNERTIQRITHRGGSLAPKPASVPRERPPTIRYQDRRGPLNNTQMRSIGEAGAVQA